MKTINRLLPSLPKPVTDRRETSGALVRFIYAFGLLMVIGYFVYYFGQVIIFFEGPGIVTADSKTISLPYIARVKSINVEPGKSVNQADMIATIYSPDLENEISKLLTSIATLNIHLQELKSKADISSSSIRLAEIRAKTAAIAENKVIASKPDHLNTSFKLDIIREAAIANQSSASLTSEKKRAEIEIDTINHLLDDLYKQLSRTRDEYNNGVIYAPTRGVIGSRVAHSGDTVVSGQNIAEIYDRNKSYVRWLMPYTKWRQPKINEKAYVLYGNNYLPGIVLEVSPVSDLMENKRTSVLREPEQGQVVKIKLLNMDEVLPVGAPVKVRMTYFSTLDRIYDNISFLLESNYGHY